MQENWVQSLGRKDLLEEEMATTPVFLLEKSHGQRILAGYNPWGHQVSETAKRLSMYTPRALS